MMNIKDYRDTIKAQMDKDSIYFATDYLLYDCESSNYISDSVSEFADGHTSIYYSDIAEYIAKNVERVADTINEFGFDGCGNDLYKAGQMAEWAEIEESINADMENIIEYCVCSYLLANGLTGIEETEYSELIPEPYELDYVSDIYGLAADALCIK